MREGTCPACFKPSDTCGCGNEYTRAANRYGLLPDSLTPNSNETPLGLGGYDRPPERCENADEVLARFSEVQRPLVVCAYCDQSIRTRKPDEALAWFQTHPCSGEGVDPVEWSRMAHMNPGATIAPT